MWWNFVGRSHDEIVEFRRRYQAELGFEPAEPQDAGKPRLFGDFPEGQPDPLPLVLKGRVVAPSFHFDDSAKEGIHFGDVSLGFLNSVDFTLTNTSEIPMRFRLRIPNEHGEEHDQFDVQPSAGIILPHGEQQLRLNFIATAVSKYNLSMLVDVEAVGDSLLSLPITAMCLAPGIKPSADALDYGDAFIIQQITITFTGV
jgi:hydrocephalus-inducing protein